METVPTDQPACRIAWCRNPHDAESTTRAHLRDLDTIVTGGEFVVAVMLVQNESLTGKLFAPVVRVFAQNGAGDPWEHRVDIPLSAAVAFGAVLGGLPGQKCRQLGRALAAGQTVFGEAAR